MGTTVASSADFNTIPANVWAEIRTALIGLAVLYLVQPVVFATMLLRHKSLVRRFAATAWFSVTLFLVATHFRRTVGIYWSANMIMLYWPFGLLMFKYVHALMDPNFHEVFQLTTFPRIALFCYCAPTIIFRSDNKDGGNDNRNRPIPTIKGQDQQQQRGDARLRSLRLLVRGVSSAF